MKKEALGKLVDIKTGKLDVNAGTEYGKYPFFTCAKTVYRINQYAFDNEAILVAGNGDLNVKYFKGKFNAYQRTYVIENKEVNLLSMKYLYYFMETYMIHLRNGAIGGIIKYIKIDHLTKAEIPLPPLDDQKRIAHLLGKVERLIAQRKQHLQQLDQLLKSVFLEMFGFFDKTYTNWTIDTLTSHTEIVSGITKGKKYKTDELIEVPYMRVANVQDEHFVLDEIKTISVTKNEIKQYRLLAGDLLLTEGGDPDKLGRGAVWQNQIENCIHQNHIFRVRVNDKSRINPDYLSALIGSPYGKSYFFRSAKQTTGIASINSTQLKKFPIVIPPIELQNRFATIVEKVESIKTHYQQSLNNLETLYNALSQKAFKGELDLSRVAVLVDVTP
uniref:Restriction endonuclease S subunits-like protein n=1 Tax=Chlorobium chlorochromatii (strain CaD3) TaxID=340177 RepID=Q3AQE4_CHLCH